MRAKRLIPSVLERSVVHAQCRIDRLRPLCPLLHLDLMDGRFVKNRSVGIGDIAKLKLPKRTTAHLMVEHPIHWAEACGAVGIIELVLHVESELSPSTVHLFTHHFTVHLAINPGTPLSRLAPYARVVNGYHVMTVRPGKQGKAFIPSQLTVLRRLRTLHPKTRLGVDGSMNETTVPLALAAGANDIILGSVLKQAPDPQATFNSLRSLV